MRRHWVKSSAIRTIGYDPQKKQLEVRYIDGDLYRYFGVPPTVAAELEQVESKGRYINLIVKKRYRYEHESS